MISIGRLLLCAMNVRMYMFPKNLICIFINEYIYTYIQDFLDNYSEYLL